MIATPITLIIFTGLALAALFAIVTLVSANNTATLERNREQMKRVKALLEPTSGDVWLEKARAGHIQVEQGGKGKPK
jgi:hypothetical protein